VPIKIIYLKHNERHNNNESRVMTITLQDIKRYSNGKTESLYSADKDEAAYELSLMGRTERGTICERWIANYITENTGYNANVTAPTHAWDITVDLNDKPVRVEVKSSLAQLNRSTSAVRYLHKAVSPEHFDYIFFVWVKPEGVAIKWAHAHELQAFCDSKTKYPLGYSISSIHEDWHDWMHDIEDFPL
jgi:hypothetical protein